MKNQLVIFILSGFCCFYFSCTNISDSNPSLTNPSTTSVEKTKNAQALILTQDFEYDPSDKDKITGAYVSKNKITIPNNLATQSKWIMFEGPVLENDVIAYRYYADSRHRFDIYAKTVPDLVMDTVGWDYHNIMNWGTDVLKVGNSLGLGSPAIYFNDTLYTLSNCAEKTIQVLNNDQTSASLRTTFKGLKIEEESFDLIQDWSINGGEPWSTIRLEVVNGQLPEGMYFATGIVKHLEEVNTGEIGDYFYAMNWGKQSFHKENMGMAIASKKSFQPELVDDQLSHAYAFKNAKREVSYQLMAAWERDNSNVKDAMAFKQLVEKVAQ